MEEEKKFVRIGPHSNQFYLVRCGCGGTPLMRSWYDQLIFRHKYLIECQGCPEKVGPTTEIVEVVKDWNEKHGQSNGIKVNIKK